MATIVYDSFRNDAYAGNIDWDADTFKAMLTTSSYTENKATHTKRSDITNEVTGTGYTAGGVTLASKTNTLTQANSFATTWAASTAYVVGNIRRPTTGNGALYRCIVAGTSHSSEPTWPTVVGRTVTETGGVEWENVGSSVNVLSAASPSWASSTITARKLVVYKARGGASSADELVCLIDFGSDVISTNGTFTGTIGVEGLVPSF